jgi:hypothetical protein
MNIGAPTSRVFQRQYGEAPGVRGLSARDSRTTSRQWINGRSDQHQAFSTARTVAKIQQDLNRLKHRVITPPLTGNQAIEPFQFYGIAPNGPYAINNPGTGYQPLDALTLVGGTLAPGGSPTTFTIPVNGTSNAAGIVILLQVVTEGNYTTPPAYPAAVSGGAGTGLTVTGVSSSDIWRTCSMRQGAIGLRSRYYDMGATTYEGYEFFNVEGMNNINMYVGDYQIIMSVNGDWQQSFDQPDAAVGAGFGSPRMLGDVGTPVLISGIEETQGDYVSWPQIVLNAPDSGGYQAAFWLEIIDSPTSKGKFVHPNLWGRMFDDLTNDAFPISNKSANNVNIIPLAIVAVENSVMYIEQFLTGNLVNLFDAYFNNSAVSGSTNGLAVGCKMCFRGDWTEDTLLGQYFYPGDVARDNPPAGTTIGGMTATSYVCLNYIGPATNGNRPSLDATNWIPLMY